MRFWIVHKNETVEAIFEAIENGSCTTEKQVEAIAAKHGDTVKWSNAWRNDETVCSIGISLEEE